MLVKFAFKGALKKIVIGAPGLKTKKRRFCHPDEVKKPEDDDFNPDKHSGYAFVFPASSPDSQVHSGSTPLKL